MRVFMLGWEFPPFISGGLGTACYGLTKALSGIGADVMFVLPRPVSTPFSTHVRLVSPKPGSPLEVPSTEFRLDEFEHVTFRTVNAQIGNPYQSAEQYLGKQNQQAAAPSYAITDTTKTAVTSSVETTKTVGRAGSAVPAPPQNSSSPYGGDLFAEIQRYANLA